MDNGDTSCGENGIPIYEISDWTPEMCECDTVPYYEQSVLEKVAVQNHPKKIEKECYNLTLTKGKCDKLFKSFQKLSMGITENQKKVLLKQLLAFKMEYEKTANILKQKINKNLTFIFNHLDSETQIIQKEKYQSWTDNINNWFSDIETKIETISSIDPKSKPIPSCDKMKKDFKPTSTSTVDTRQECHEILEYTEAEQTHATDKCETKLYELCKSTGDDKYNLENHDDKSHTETVQKKNETENKRCKQDNQCSVCLKYFKSRKVLKKHSFEHKILYHKCYYCDKLCKSILELRKHLRRHLADEAKKFKCNVCYRHFDTKSKIKRHLKQQHHLATNKYPDKMLCIICGLGYYSSHKLMSHLQNDHKGDSEVQKSGRDKGRGLSSHQCRFCDIFCINLKLREVHIITAHGVPPYECAVCSARFITKAFYDAHVLKHSNQDALKAGLCFQRNGRLFKPLRLFK